MQNDKKREDQRLARAYDKMLERIRQGLGQEPGVTKKGFTQALEAAREKAVELGELTREEAERIGEYLVRDFRDLVSYRSETGNDLRDWLHFDIELIEDTLLDMMAQVADRTTLEELLLFKQLERMSEYHTGEVAGVGTLKCKQCGKLLHFHKTSRIPPCPQCHGTVFTRVEQDESPASG